MLTIRPAQMRAFEEQAAAQYNEELAADLEQFSPRLAAVLKREGLRSLVHRQSNYGT